MNTNPLYQTVYSGKIEQSAFQKILGCLDNTIAIFVSREEFNSNYANNFLIEVGKDDFSERYNLYLPEDLQYIELLNIIDILDAWFDIQKYTKIDSLLAQTKVAVAKSIQGLGTKEAQEKIDSYIRESGISNGLQDRIKEINIRDHIGPARSILEENNRGTSLRTSIGENYEAWFEKTFLRRGINILRLGLMTFTQNDAIALNVKTGEIEQRVSAEGLDITEQKLRDAIGIDEYKDKLVLLRDQGDDIGIEDLEREVLEKILESLFEYPYQDTPDQDSYKPSKIPIKKELQCVGFSCVVHAFLEELGIEHVLIVEPEHVAVGAIVGGKRYILDASEESFWLCEYSISGDKYIIDGERIETHIGDIYEQEIENGIMATLYLNLSSNYKGRLRDELFYKSDMYDSESMSNFYTYLESFERNGEYDSLLSECDIFLGKYPGNTEVRLYRVIALFNLKKYKASIDNLYFILQEDCGNALAYQYLGKNYQAQGNEELAGICHFIMIYFQGRPMDNQYCKERKKIKQYLDDNKYEGLFVFLRSQESEG